MVRRRPRTPQFGVGNVLGRSLSLWFRNLLPFTILALVVYSPRFVYSLVSSPDTYDERMTHALVTFLAELILLMVVTGSLVYGVLERLRGKEADVVACLRAGLTRLLPVLGVTVLSYLVALLAALPLAFAAAVARVPALLLGAFLSFVATLSRFWLSVPVAVVERKGVFGSIRRGIQLVQGRGFAIFAILLLLFVLLYAAKYLVLRSGPRTAIGLDVGWLLVGILHGTLMAVTCAVTYHDLRVAKEGVTTDDLVRVFA